MRFANTFGGIVVSWLLLRDLPQDQKPNRGRKHQYSCVPIWKIKGVTHAEACSAWLVLHALFIIQQHIITHKWVRFLWLANASEGSVEIWLLYKYLLSHNIGWESIYFVFEVAVREIIFFITLRKTSSMHRQQGWGNNLHKKMQST